MVQKSAARISKWVLKKLSLQEITSCVERTHEDFCLTQPFTGLVIGLLTCGRKFGRGVSLGGGINCGTLMG